MRSRPSPPSTRCETPRTAEPKPPGRRRGPTSHPCSSRPTGSRSWWSASSPLTLPTGSRQESLRRLRHPGMARSTPPGASVVFLSLTGHYSRSHASFALGPSANGRSIRWSVEQRERAVADSGWHDHGSTARPRPDDGGNPARRAVAPGTRASQARARLEVEGRAIVRIVVPVTLLSIRLGCYALGAIVASGGRSAGWAASANRCQCERSCGRVAVKTCWPGRSWP